MYNINTNQKLNNRKIITAIGYNNNTTTLHPAYTLSSVSRMS